MYMVSSMVLVALTITSSVVVTNIYKNNINNKFRFLWVQHKVSSNAKEETTDATGCNGKAKTTVDETVDLDKCKKLAMRLDRILFCIWVSLYGTCCVVCLLLIIII